MSDNKISDVNHYIGLNDATHGEPQGRFAYIVVRRRDFWSAPQLIRVFTNYDKMMDFMWKEAKRLWRYSGKPQESYTYFDQELRFTQVILED